MSNNYQGRYKLGGTTDSSDDFKESGTYTLAVPSHVLGKLHTIQAVAHPDKALSWCAHWAIEQAFRKLISDIREENGNA